MVIFQPQQTIPQSVKCEKISPIEEKLLLQLTLLLLLLLMLMMVETKKKRITFASRRKSKKLVRKNAKIYYQNRATPRQPTTIYDQTSRFLRVTVPRKANPSTGSERCNKQDLSYWPIYFTEKASIFHEQRTGAAPKPSTTCRAKQKPIWRGNTLKSLICSSRSPDSDQGFSLSRSRSLHRIAHYCTRNLSHIFLRTFLVTNTTDDDDESFHTFVFPSIQPRVEQSSMDGPVGSPMTMLLPYLHAVAIVQQQFPGPPQPE